MSIRIEETTRGDVEQYTLHVNDFPAAHVQVLPHGVVLNWAVYGPQQWPEAKLVLEGLLELGLLADKLTLRSPYDEKVHRKKARQKAVREEDDGPPDPPTQIRFGKRGRDLNEVRPGSEAARSGGMLRPQPSDVHPAGKKRGVRKVRRARR